MQILSYMPTPQGLMARVRDSGGKEYDKLLRHGPELEPDPDRFGYARLRTDVRYSVFRGGKSYCALGLPENEFPVTIGAAAIQTFNFKDAIQEPGHLGRLIMDGVPTTPTLFLTDVSRYGDSLMSGNVSGKLFLRDSVYNPIFGHYIDPNTQLTITFRNRGGAAIDVAPTFGLI